MAAEQYTGDDAPVEHQYHATTTRSALQVTPLSCNLTEHPWCP
jgi:hypothetical protein